MNRRSILSITALAAFGLAVLPGSAIAQQKTLKEQIIGTWIIVSSDSTAPDGKKEQLFGPNPKGILVFDASGQTVQVIVHPGVPKFKVNNRLKGTAEENTAAVHGTTATFGTFTVDEASKMGSMVPNQTGTESTRMISVSGDELKMHVPAIGAGGSADNVWQRAK